MKLTVNGNATETQASTVRELLDEMGILPERVAVEVNLSIIKKADFASLRLNDGDKVEIVSFVGGGQMDDKLIIKGIGFHSRLWVGTGKYKDFEETRRVIEASGTDVVTVAVRT